MVGHNFGIAVNDQFKFLAGFFDGQSFENDFQANAIDVAAGYSNGNIVHVSCLFKDASCYFAISASLCLEVLFL
jgi:hypothetical protein